MQKSYTSSGILILVLSWSIFVLSLATEPSSAARLGAVTPVGGPPVAPGKGRVVVTPPVQAPTVSTPRANAVGTQAQAPSKANAVGTPAKAPSGANTVGGSAQAPSGAKAAAPAPLLWYLDPKLPNSRIIYTRPLPERTNVTPETYYLKILATVYNGSQEEAKRQLVRSMTDVSAFIAHMTAAQADQLLTHPDVLQVDDIENKTRLHPGLTK